VDQERQSSEGAELLADGPAHAEAHPSSRHDGDRANRLSPHPKRARHGYRHGRRSEKPRQLSTRDLQLLSFGFFLEPGEDHAAGRRL
jgi:hypothetical protein